MLRFLKIRHLAVIDALEVEFGGGLSVLTGETGAGKSIIVEAVGLLLGGRASPDLVRTGEEQATLEAVFDAADGREVIVRREISPQGRSRAFVDGALATAAALRDVCTGLVDIHGQHEHQQLLDPQSHLDLLDAYGQLEASRASVESAFDAWQQARGELERSVATDRDRAARLDFARFQLGEIDRVQPQPGEDEQLAAARQVLANADRLQRLCEESYALLYEGEQAALAALAVVWRRVSELASLDGKFTPYLDAKESVKTSLEDLALFLRSYASALDASPARLQEVEDRLATIERLKKKYGPTLQDVLDRREMLRRDLASDEGSMDRTAQLEDALRSMQARYLSAARALSAARHAAADRLVRQLEQQLAGLAMERTRCAMRFNDSDLPEGGWTARGLDEAEFYLSPNPGEELRPLARIASGGELSRIMLALKTLASTDAPGKTLIFDEVDAGIGGRVADVLGSRLQALGRRFQVLCITHLPQIAAHATDHFRVTKRVRGGRTTTAIERLTGGDRVEEIARMMAGREVTDKVRGSARELLESRAAPGGKENTKGESERVKAKGKRLGQEVSD